MPSPSPRSISFPRLHCKCCGKNTRLQFLSVALGAIRSALPLGGWLGFQYVLLITASPRRCDSGLILPPVNSRAAPQCCFSLVAPPFSAVFLCLRALHSFLSQQRPLDCFHLIEGPVYVARKEQIHLHDSQGTGRPPGGDAVENQTVREKR
jgi:hypothetical protein